jgi:hypothetical protein
MNLTSTLLTIHSLWEAFDGVTATMDAARVLPEIRSAPWAIMAPSTGGRAPLVGQRTDALGRPFVGICPPFVLPRKAITRPAI